MTKPLTDDHEDLLIDMLHSGMEWHRPLDLGGRDGSQHSSQLRTLERRGYVESKQRSAHTSRGSKKYRLTEQGKRTATDLEQLRNVARILRSAGITGGSQ